LAALQVDLTELQEQATLVTEHLGELLATVEQSMQEERPPADEDELTFPSSQSGLTPSEEQHLEQLFDQARQDKAKAYELKQELDRLDVFSDYEDRFLDLFKKEGPPGSTNHEGHAP
jgi:hypothetical protein